MPEWMWPAIAGLALVVGVAAGVLGGALYGFVDDRTSGAGLRLADLRTEPPLPLDNDSVAAVAAELMPSTVQVLAGVPVDDDAEEQAPDPDSDQDRDRSDPDGEDEGERGGRGAATGSGFVLDARGHVVTNNHVVADAAESGATIVVLDSDGEQHRAEVVGRSRVYDLAVLRVGADAGLRPAALGASETLRVGDPVVAIGAPLGLSQTVTAGIISALDRPVTAGENRDEASFINAVQTDAAINPGNSGGPLVNLAGEVVGVNSAIATTGGFLQEAGSIGVGFAIPIEQVVLTADQILSTGRASYPVIGATVQTGGRGAGGARIEEVTTGSPAAEGGVRDGDLVVALDGERVTDGVSLIVQIRTREPGDSVELTVEREGDRQSLTVVLGSELD